MSSKGSAEEHVINSKSDNMEQTKLLKNFLNHFFIDNKLGWKHQWKRVIDIFNLLYYKCHKIKLNCVGSCIDFPYWIRNKKAAITPVNDDEKCFHHDK